MLEELVIEASCKVRKAAKGSGSIESKFCTGELFELSASEQIKEKVNRQGNLAEKHHQDNSRWLEILSLALGLLPSSVG